LDKTTQNAAAFAEETAGAAEELSAQALTTQDAVNELLTVVRGAGNQKRTPRAIVRQPKASRAKLSFSTASA
jgi:hypothetical protein